jgi:hypothetical protein
MLKEGSTWYEGLCVECTANVPSAYFEKHFTVEGKVLHKICEVKNHPNCSAKLCPETQSQKKF